MRTFIGDLVVLMLFAVVGLKSHQQAISLTGILTNAGPIIGVWLGLSLLTKIYQRASWQMLAIHWFAAVTCGVLLRFLIVGRPFSPVFWLITLGFTGVLLLLWRVIDHQLSRRSLQV